MCLRGFTLRSERNSFVVDKLKESNFNAPPGGARINVSGVDSTGVTLLFT